MKIINSTNIEQSEYTIVALGNFDGLHLGHKKLIDFTINYSSKNTIKSAIFSLSPHPEEFFKKNKDFVRIFSEKEKISLLEEMNIDLFINYPFDENISYLEPIEFLSLVIKKLKCKVLVVGQDFRFGKDRKGDINFLTKECRKIGVDVVVIPDVHFECERVSSSRIRSAILNHNLDLVTSLLGREYFIIGEVVKGNQIGRTIGFPTANIIVNGNKILLPDGVYVTRTIYNNKVFDSITNIGINPTVNNTSRTVETFIFDFNENIYGKDIKVMFLTYVRSVKKFSGIEELKNQIELDTQFARQIFQIV